MNVTSATISIHDVQKEISKQFAQLMPTKYCKSSEKVCPTGPAGLPGPIGTQGPRGIAGGDLGEREVTQVALDHLENQEWLDFQDLEEKRVTKANQEIQDRLGGLENRYLLHKLKSDPITCKSH